jgi:small subunit ribosomal protein S14
MSMFRAKKLDLGCFVNVRTLRDHTKRKVFEANETERYAKTLPTTTKPTMD